MRFALSTPDIFNKEIIMNDHIYRLVQKLVTLAILIVKLAQGILVLLNMISNYRQCYFRRYAVT
jgi:hypothetical protein